jgi:hypothetical protein
MTPKYIIGTDKDDEREFIVHMDHPRFVAEVIENAVTPIEWIDDRPEDFGTLIVDAAIAYQEFARLVTAN